MKRNPFYLAALIDINNMPDAEREVLMSFAVGEWRKRKVKQPNTTLVDVAVSILLNRGEESQ
jgi:hypothetical protein